MTGTTLSSTGSYTDENAQDAVGSILQDTTTVDLVYDDATPYIQAEVKTDSLTNTHVNSSAGIALSKLASITQTNLIGRRSASSGVPEEISVGTGLSLSGTTLSCLITQYTDEMAQDSVGGSLTDSSSIDFTYDDVANTITAVVKAGSVTNAMLAGSIAASKLVGSDVATVGTIGTGVWQGTKVNLAYGGTNADLSATGAAKSYLKQSSSGASITVGTIPAGDYPTFVAAGGSHAVGGVPDPGSTSHANDFYVLGDDAAFHALPGKVLAYSFVNTQESTASTSYVDLTTVQSMSITTDASTDVLVYVFAAYINTGSATAVGAISANLAGSDNIAAQTRPVDTSNAVCLVGAVKITLASGANTLKMRFKVTAGTGFFSQRMIVVTRAP
jgi:hypothetical protein